MEGSGGSLSFSVELYLQGPYGSEQVLCENTTVFSHISYVSFSYINLKIVDVSLSIIISLPKAPLRCTLYISTLFSA